MKGIKAREKGKKKVYKVGFWNVAGLENKDKDILVEFEGVRHNVS